MDKLALKARMLKLEHEELDHAVEHYEAFLSDSRLDEREAHDRDEYAAARQNADLAHAFDHPVHEHEAKIAVLEDMEFSPKSEVSQGAVIGFSGRVFVVSVSTRRFTFEGQEMMGISIESPLYKKIAGLQEGDTFDMAGKDITLDMVV